MSPLSSRAGPVYWSRPAHCSTVNLWRHVIISQASMILSIIWNHDPHRRFQCPAAGGNGALRVRNAGLPLTAASWMHLRPCRPGRLPEPEPEPRSEGLPVTGKPPESYSRCRVRVLRRLRAWARRDRAITPGLRHLDGWLTCWAAQRSSE